MSKTPLVKTTGRASSARRGSSSARGHSLATKSGSTRRLCSAPARALMALTSPRLRSVQCLGTTMLVLCGLPISNYYSKVKLALLEKGVPFEEDRVGTAGVGAKSESALRDSPLGKIPFMRTPDG